MTRRFLLSGLLALASSLVLAAGASAAYFPGWTAPYGGASVHGGTLALDNVTHAPAAGVSYEATDVAIPVSNGDVIRFDYKGVCSGGAPRVFIMWNNPLLAPLFNTWDTGPGSCGVPLGGGWYRIASTVTGLTGTADGAEAGHIGIVNDQIADRSVIQFRHLKIAGVEVSLRSMGEED